MKKITVGLSGGVDSSVAATLLLDEGYEVTGAFMKNWSDEGEGNDCGWRAERRDAMRVAAALGIPFVTYDFEREYRERITEYMVREYKAGRTPNPDVLCNNLVKFDLLLDRAIRDGADGIATGHYARIFEAGGLFSLLAGLDPDKDQSYFLHRLDQTQLSWALFPLGEFTKKDVRRIAAEKGLPTAEKKDSQGLCFVGHVDMKEFLSRYIDDRPGPTVSVSGKELGRHDGMAHFTIGQRHGIGLGGGEPVFVVGKDMEKNALIVARGEDPPELYRKELEVADAHWVLGMEPEMPLRCMARIRYRQPLQDVSVTSVGGGGYKVAFDEPQRAVTPGQFAVFYDSDICLGGGVISQ